MESKSEDNDNLIDVEKRYFRQRERWDKTMNMRKVDVEKSKDISGRSQWNIEIYLHLILIYLHVKRPIRVLYFSCMVPFLSLYVQEIGKEFFTIEVFTGKQSTFNQAFVKWGWAWTLGLFLAFRIFCLGLRPKWQHHLSNLIVRAFVTTIFFYIWCQVIFPSVEKWTGQCTKDDDVIEYYISRKNCMKHKSHKYESFDTSGHAFLLSYCIFVLMEESREILYVNSLGKLLRNSKKLNDKELHDLKSGFSMEHIDSVRSRYYTIVPMIILSLLSVFFLCVLWDIMLIVTNVFYHTFAEKFLATFLAICNWYLIYPIFFVKYNLL